MVTLKSEDHTNEQAGNGDDQHRTHADIVDLQHQQPRTRQQIPQAAQDTRQEQVGTPKALHRMQPTPPQSRQRLQHRPGYPNRSCSNPGAG